MQPTQIIEALLFASDAPLTVADMAGADDSLDEAAVEAAIHALRMAYEREDRAFQVYELAGGFQILTRPEFAPYLERFDTVVHTARLSTAALEVLAIIAYRQPIGRAEIEEIRGVGSSGVLRTLQERELITPVARGDGLGRPLLYGTTARFLEHFGFRSLEDLPRPEDLPVVLGARSTEAPDAEPRDDGASREAAGDAAATDDSADTAAPPADAHEPAARSSGADAAGTAGPAGG